MKTHEKVILSMDIQRSATVACTVAARMQQTMRLALGACAIAAAGMAQAVTEAPAAAEATAASPAPTYIAGTAPDRRRADIPVIKEAQPLDKKTAFRGVDEPYPASLSVFDSQGAWYTPFIHPGMTGPYDIRGYHHPKGQGQ